MNARTSYREAAVRGASPIRLVICLYEQAVEDLRRAVDALEKKDIQARTRAINHALMVVGQLQGTLDMQRGGEVARHLDRFYSVVRAGLISAQCKQSAEIIEQQIAHLALVHGAWLEVERSTMLSASGLPGSEPEQRASSLFALEEPAEGWNA
jgi:flagellar secretion chaperone FliS